MILPMHPHPQQGEIFSSWLVRLAFANGFTLHTFYNKVLGYKGSIWNRDADRHPSDTFLDILSRSTGLTVNEIKHLTLCSYEGILFEKLTMIGNAPWIMPLGIFHRQHRRTGMQFCPLCLKMDAVPFYRKKWRLAFYAACDRHQCVMHECCPSCKSPVAYHRHGVGRNRDVFETSIYLCHNCQFDFRDAPLQYMHWPDAKSWQLLMFTLTFFEQGAWDVFELPTPCGVSFFMGLHILEGLIRGRHGERLREALSEKIGYEFKIKMASTETELELYSAEERLELILICFWLLDSWPKRFVDLCAETGLTRSRMSEAYVEIPFWLTKVVNEHLDRRPYILSAEEIFTAGEMLRSQGTVGSAKALGKILGVSRDRAIKAAIIWRRGQNGLIH